MGLKFQMKWKLIKARACVIERKKILTAHLSRSKTNGRVVYCIQGLLD